MNEKMRRFKQELSPSENEEILRRGTHGVLAMTDRDGMPYALPVSYYFADGIITIHCAREGKKLDCIRNSPKVSFCVVDMDEIHPERYTTHFRSTIVFGNAEILPASADRDTFLKLAEKYSPGNEEGCRAEVDQSLERANLIRITPLCITGKEAVELKKQKESHVGI